MLAKAIATNFNCPFVPIPGSGFAATFIGIDVMVVMYLIRKAKKLARKWGGQCIIFIDEIDAVGMRRASLGQGPTGMGVGDRTDGSESLEDFCCCGRRRRAPPPSRCSSSAPLTSRSTVSTPR